MERALLLWVSSHISPDHSVAAHGLMLKKRLSIDKVRASRDEEQSLLGRSRRCWIALRIHSTNGTESFLQR